MSDRVNNFYKAHEAAEHVSRSLNSMARAFERVGNSTCADELLDLADYLDKAIEQMHGEFRGLINDAYAQSRDSFFAPLKTILERMEK